ncbi:hypothetical protein ACFFJT_17695 [Dyella flava]|uniref:Uncharacterized protein n=1 Tax=Dyella flava TaxID=1920170 RepID=A0ABS2K4H7_9GAMM|nr:hypothetical protein [Dyella flava]MBM7125652.1 hypothetical protein [Dyella flava]GLQ48834.1 hypothetical protein GCM10010872_02830 [Dyella flava]
MSDSTETSASVADSKSSAPKKAVKSGLAKVIPTDRVSFDKQASALRAYAAASGREKKAVTNEEVSAVMSDLVASSISLCNPFFSDAGLLVQEGRKLRPVEAVFDFQHAYEWNADTAGHKLGPVFSQHWATKCLVPKLAFRQLSKDEAISFLAEESKATTSHRKNLETLLEFLSFAGVIRLDGNAVFKTANQNPPATGKEATAAATPSPSEPPPTAKAIDDPTADLDPMIQGLFKKLPKSGDWGVADRIKWLQTAASIFGLIYTNSDTDVSDEISVMGKSSNNKNKDPQP